MLIANKHPLINEDWLHYLWKFRLFRQKELKTVDGAPIDIISVGIHNQHAGPDFDHAKIKVADTIWVGTVEIHLRSSDWKRHRHQHDKAYNNVILHVVYQHDAPITRQDGTAVPILMLENLISDEMISKYQQFMYEPNWIPCQYHLSQVDDDAYVKTWLSRILIERFEEKYEIIHRLLVEYKGAWEEVLYIMLAKNFGFKMNALPFELLARSLPQKILAKHKNSPFQIEALLFGQAGFLTDSLEDDYPNKLKEEYIFLQKKYGLLPIDRYLWKFMRLRPQNFPSLRLAQFAAFMLPANHLFSAIVELEDLQQIRQLFKKCPIHPYWQTHYRFDVETAKFSNNLGEESITNLLINTIALFLFAYGKHIDDERYLDRAITLLENIAPECNQVIDRFKTIGIKVDQASISQALLQLKTHYCDKKRCLHCGIGMKLLNSNAKSLL